LRSRGRTRPTSTSPRTAPGGQIDIAFTAPVTTFTIRYDNLMRTAPRPAGQNNDQTAFVTASAPSTHRVLTMVSRGTTA
ncbi:hypothetical protein GY12_22650, partial [Micrococcus luteus]